MDWRSKARIQHLCALLPGGDFLYRQIQRRFGRLNADPFKRLPMHARMVRQLAELGLPSEGIRCLEVGTGHLPIAPVAFFLLGARETVTVDLHRRLDAALTSRMLARLAAEKEQLLSLYDGLVEPDHLSERLAEIGRLVHNPHKCLQKIGVRYLAPGDASRMPDAAGSFDLTFSMTVLEHVTRDALRSMFGEAHRVLGPNGWAAHMIDPSDHFAHQDRTITRINFLRFSDPEWMRLAGNEYAYCNRLRAPEFERTLTESGFRVEHVDRTVDERSVIALGEGFPLHGDFQQFTAAELCTTNLEIYAHR